MDELVKKHIFAKGVVGGIESAIRHISRFPIDTPVTSLIEALDNLRMASMVNVDAIEEESRKLKSDVSGDGNE